MCDLDNTDIKFLLKYFVDTAKKLNTKQKTVRGYSTRHKVSEQQDTFARNNAKNLDFSLDSKMI